MAEVKYKFGLQDVHVAKITGYDATNGYTYGTPVKIPGAISLDIKKLGSTDPIFADNIPYAQLYSNQGYDGEIEFTAIPDWFRETILNEEDMGGVQLEKSDNQPAEFALLFQFEEDKNNARRHCMYRCYADRPDLSSSTKNEKVEVKTEKLTLKAMPRENDHYVKAACQKGNEAYSGWFDSVHEPSDFAECRLSVLTASGLTISPAFDSDEYNYTATGTAGTSTVSATAMDTDATVVLKLGNTALVGDSAALVEGANVITAVVTNGTNTVTYTITATCAAGD